MDAKTVTLYRCTRGSAVGGVTVRGEEIQRLAPILRYCHATRWSRMRHNLESRGWEVEEVRGESAIMTRQGA